MAGRSIWSAAPESSLTSVEVVAGAMSWACSSVARLRDSPPPAPARTAIARSAEARCRPGAGSAVRPRRWSRSVPWASPWLGRAPERSPSGNRSVTAYPSRHAPPRRTAARRAGASADWRKRCRVPGLRPGDWPLRQGRGLRCRAESRRHGCSDASRASGARQAPAPERNRVEADATAALAPAVTRRPGCVGAAKPRVGRILSSAAPTWGASFDRVRSKKLQWVGDRHRGPSCPLCSRWLRQRFPYWSGPRPTAAPSSTESSQMRLARVPISCCREP